MRKCDRCGAAYLSQRWRHEQILGRGFFVVLTMQDLSTEQRADVIQRGRHCSDECAAAERVRVAFEKESAG